MQNPSKMQTLSKHTHALVALGIVLASTVISGQTFPDVKATESRGTLDVGFGTGGKVTTDVGGSGGVARSVAVQPNGRIVAAGGTFLTRYNTDGMLDGSFGAGGGIVSTDSVLVLSVAVQPDGKIVAAGQTLINGSTDFSLVRYNNDGTLDASFGTGGTVTTDVSTDGNNDLASSVVVQPNGKIVVAGQTIISESFDFAFALARYNTDGTLDASFGTGGIVTTDFAASLTQAVSVALQTDGKIVAAGQTFVNGSLDFALARYNPDGTLDASFGTGGTVTTDFASRQDRAFSVAIQPDRKIVAAGQATIGGFDFALARYNPDGTLDASFGTGGMVTTSFVGGSFDFAFSVALQPNGKIVAAGQVLFIGGFDFALVRYNRDGTLDASFGTGGSVTTDFARANDGAFSVGVQPNGKIVAAGSAVIGGSSQFALVRYK